MSPRVAAIGRLSSAPEISSGRGLKMVQPVALLVVLQFVTAFLCVASHSLGSDAAAAYGDASSTRKVIEHVYLWESKVDLDEAAENEFLYAMWNLKNTVTNVDFLSFTVGRIINSTPQNVRYAMRGRFPSVDHLNLYLGNKVVWAWVGEHLSPVAGAEFGIDYEAEVSDTYDSLHRIGKGFETGVEYVLLLTAKEGTSPDAAFSSLISSASNSVVEVTAGPAAVKSNAGLTHGVAAHLKSAKSVDEFRDLPAVQEVLASSSQYVEAFFYPFQTPTLATE